MVKTIKIIFLVGAPVTGFFIGKSIENRIEYHRNDLERYINDSLTKNIPSKRNFKRWLAKWLLKYKGNFPLIGGIIGAVAVSIPLSTKKKIIDTLTETNATITIPTEVAETDLLMQEEIKLQKDREKYSITARRTLGKLMIYNLLDFSSSSSTITSLLALAGMLKYLFSANITAFILAIDFIVQLVKEGKISRTFAKILVQLLLANNIKIPKKFLDILLDPDS